MSDKQRSTSQARRKPTPGPCKPTPGPWKTELRKDSPSDVPWYPIRNLLITAGTREYKINCNCAVDLANARLMAAAPELLEILEELYNDALVMEQPRFYKALSEAKKLIAKIEGDE
jgi:hypothetical protein